MRVYRYSVPVDDRPHLVKLTGRIVRVAAPYPAGVDFWALADGTNVRDVIVQVFATGQDIPVGYEYQGTTERTQGLVWHLFADVREPLPSVDRSDL